MRRRMRFPTERAARSAGFTLIEMLIGSLIMLVVVVGALSVYVKSNKTSADQMQLARLQQDVRASMYYLARDARMAGAGLPPNFYAFALEGADNEDQGGDVQPDRLTIMGNIDAPFALPIQSLSKSGKKVILEDYSLEQFPYPDSYYLGKIILVLPRPSSSCVGGVLRQITAVAHKKSGGFEGFSFSPSAPSGINPPNGLSDVCADGEFDGGSVGMDEVRSYWLDVTGSVSGLTTGVDGYIGGGTGGVLYMTKNAVHYPLAQNIENIQFQYNGDFDGDTGGTLDGFANWNAAWTADQVARIRQVRIWVLGRTPDRFVSVSGTAAGGTHLYRRPAIANSPAETADDRHRRFLLESTANVRNMSLDLYNRER